jgi:hypothetical protein
MCAVEFTHPFRKGVLRGLLVLTERGVLGLLSTSSPRAVSGRILCMRVQVRVSSHKVGRFKPLTFHAQERDVPNVGLEHHVVKSRTFEIPNNILRMFAGFRANLERNFCSNRQQSPTTLFLERQHAHIRQMHLRSI